VKVVGEESGKEDGTGTSPNDTGRGDV